jgi:hypothetical protein
LRSRGSCPPRQLAILAGRTLLRLGDHATTQRAAVVHSMPAGSFSACARPSKLFRVVDEFSGRDVKRVASAIISSWQNPQRARTGASGRALATARFATCSASPPHPTSPSGSTRVAGCLSHSSKPELDGIATARLRAAMTTAKIDSIRGKSISRRRQPIAAIQQSCDIWSRRDPVPLTRRL